MVDWWMGDCMVGLLIRRKAFRMKEWMGGWLAGYTDGWKGCYRLDE